MPSTGRAEVLREVVAEAAAEADVPPTIRAARTIRMLMPVIFGIYVVCAGKKMAVWNAPT